MIAPIKVTLEYPYMQMVDLRMKPLLYSKTVSCFQAFYAGKLPFYQ